MYVPPSLGDIVLELERRFPLYHAEPWDNVGLILGDKDQQIRSIMTCLTVTPEVVAEAVDQKVDLIVSHHPMLFKPVQRINSDSVEGRMLLELLANKIALYSPHTAYDNAEGGINDQLAFGLELQNKRPLVPASSTAAKHAKIVVYLPESDLHKVSDALFSAGAGSIGEYRDCSFRASGIGTFFCGENTNPTIGQPGKKEEVAEFRLEVICPLSKLAKVLVAMKEAHSYEEPAYDLVMLHADPAQGGAGRVGTLKESVSSEILGRKVAEMLKQKHVAITGAHRDSIQKVAIVCGAGGSLLQNAIRSGADAFLTGEIRFHDELAAKAANVTVIAAGHYATERPGVEQLAKVLGETFSGMTVFASGNESDPMKVEFQIT